ncbi:unnamed protein product, partial [Pylaiella littoralis]
MESFDLERLEMLDDLKDVRLSPEQLSVLSDKVMKCERDDQDFKIIANLRKFWRRHRENLVSLENFRKHVDRVCGITPEEDGGNLNVAGGSGSGSVGSAPVASHGGMVNTMGMPVSGLFSHASSGEMGDTESNLSGSTELEQGGAGDVGGVSEDAPWVGANEDGDEDTEVAQFADENTEVAKFVDDNIDGFLAKKRWPISHTSFVRPGDGYWKDDHGDNPPIQSFLTSTADGLEKAEQRPMPEYIAGNPFWRIEPKWKFVKQEEMYRRCKKMAVTCDGKPFRATNEEILDALEEDGIDLNGKSAEFYVKAVAEARRRHDNSRQTGAAARGQRRKMKSRAQRRQEVE